MRHGPGRFPREAIASVKDGGWRNYSAFTNQGDCVSFVATKGKDPPANP